MLFAARGLRSGLAPNLRAAVGELLVALGVDREFVAREIAAMEPIAFGRATNRRVLGSMNDLAFQASVHISRGDDLLATSRRLAGTPMSAIGAKRGHLGYPVKIARDLLSTARLQWPRGRHLALDAPFESGIEQCWTFTLRRNVDFVWKLMQTSS